MSLPNLSTFTEYTPELLGEFYGTVIKEIAEERDAVIAARDKRIGELERMLDEAYARVEDLLPKMDGEGSLMKEEF